MNRDDLQRLSMLRQREAKSLLDVGLYAGSYYLIGYAVECALKAYLAKQVRRYDFPDLKRVRDSYTHDLEALLRLSGLTDQLLADQQRHKNWTIVKDWSEQARYTMQISKAAANDLYVAATTRGSGVLPWLRKHW